MRTEIYRSKQKQKLDMLEAVIIFDLWLLMKYRWFLNHTVRILAPVMKVCFFMILGAGLLLIYAFSQTKLDIHGNYCQKSNSIVSKYLEIGDDSKSETTNVQKELVRTKHEKDILEKTIQRMSVHLRNMQNDRLNMDMYLADFASEAVGGLVIDTPDTKSYYQTKSAQVTLFGIPVWRPNYYTPRKVIQPWTQPGECWAFQGSHGKIEIELAQPAIVNRVTLEHIPFSASLTGKIDSAPKAFNVLGKINNEYVMIGTFTYKDKGSPSQIFEIIKSNVNNIPFKSILLEILSNYGNSDYTCIYRFKVHGKIYQDTLNKIDEEIKIS